VRSLLLVILIACGDNLPAVPTDATDGDAPPDTPRPPAGCDWAELDDALNDLALANGVAEPTALTLASTTTTICGQVDVGHAASSVVDSDAFEVTAVSRIDLRVELAGEAAALAGLEVRVVDAGGAIVDAGAYLGSHVAFQTTLLPGGYRLVVVASNPTEVATAIPYKLRTTVPPACAAVSRAAAVVENGDGPQSDRNDMVEVRYAPTTFALTAATNDDPEDTGLITVAGTDVRITGTSANVDGPDAFKDRDTYLIETGAHDELAVRIDWTANADLDFFVFAEGTTTKVASGTRVGMAAPELATFPVLPSTRYWLWVGSFDSTTALPLDYDVTLCPTQFEP
jgi:hypothetical protein